MHLNPKFFKNPLSCQLCNQVHCYTKKKLSTDPLSISSNSLAHLKIVINISSLFQHTVTLAFSADFWVFNFFGCAEPKCIYFIDSLGHSGITINK